jgi:hypothetical protein
MFNRESILKSLNTENYYIDKHSLDLFLEDWKIEAIYEDEDGLEFYDELALEKIKRGISLKAQGFTDEQIIAKLAKIEARVEKYDEPPKPVQPVILDENGDEIEGGLEEAANNIAVQEAKQQLEAEAVQQPAQTQGKSFTLDVSSQTLQMLAEAVAKKISDDITNSNLTEKLIEAGGYKRDNEILARQVKELIEHNKELSKRIEQLESHESKSFWARFWGKR